MKTARRSPPALLSRLVGAWATACAATLVACQRTPQAGPLGQVAWISGDSLWAQALPAEKPRLLGVAAGLSRPVYAPSGRWLAVRASDGLRLVRTDGSGGEKLSGPEATDYAWAPTDDRVAYVAGGNLLLTRAGGIGTVLVDRTGAPAVTSVSWSPDGQWLVFGLEAAPSGDAVGPATAATATPRASSGARTARSTLWRMSARGGTPTPLPTPAHPVAGSARAGWTADAVPALALPDGRHWLDVRPVRDGTAALRLADGPNAEGRLVARLERPAAAAVSEAAPQPWTDLVAYSLR